MTAYEFFRDQGSIIAGVLAVIAAAVAVVAAYKIGEQQRDATLEAAREQLEADKTAAVEADHRERRNLVFQLEYEALRIKNEAADRVALMDRMYPSSAMQRAQIGSSMREPFKIVPREVLASGRDVAILLAPDTCDAIIGLLTSCDLLNSQLEIKTQVTEFHVDEFKGALITVTSRADGLLSALQRERNR